MMNDVKNNWNIIVAIERTDREAGHKLAVKFTTVLLANRRAWYTGEPTSCLSEFAIATRPSNEPGSPPHKTVVKLAFRSQPEYL